VMDYPCAKFGDFSFSRFGFTVLTDRENLRHRFTDRTLGLSNQIKSVDLLRRQTTKALGRQT